MLQTMPRRIIAGLVVLVFLTAATYGLYLVYNQSGLRNELKNGTVRSTVTIGDLSQHKEHTLYKTCLVWGLAKYYHPGIVGSEVDWDKALLDKLPALLSAPSQEEVDLLLYDWISSLGAFSTAPLPEELQTANLVAACDFSWTEDRTLFSEELCTLLSSLRNTNLSERSTSYAFYQPTRTFLVDFSNENYYSKMPEDDEGYRLLSAFRLWNVIQYYYPYLEGMTDMHTLFFETLHEFAAAETRYEYERAVLRFGAKLQDTHVRVMGAMQVTSKEFGNFIAPFRFNSDNGRVLVTGIVTEYEDRCGVKTGDYILRMNGVDVKELIESRKELISVSTDDALFSPLHPYLFCGHENTLRFDVEREGKVLSVETECTRNAKDLKYPIKTEDIVMLENNIGYVNAGKISYETVPTIPGRFQNARGMIFDLRPYPKATLMYGWIPAWLKSEPAPFTLMDHGSVVQPGVYNRLPIVTGGEPLPNGLQTYKGKVVVLANDNSLSQSEFVTMSIRSAPNSIVIGTPTCGADGDVTQVRIPGGMSMWFTSLGVYTPEGEATQRVGVQPDIRCEVTPEGLREGRDELMEAAIMWILS